jgi:hypothetical protein
MPLHTQVWSGPARVGVRLGFREEMDLDSFKSAFSCSNCGGLVEMWGVDNHIL